MRRLEFDRVLALVAILTIAVSLPLFALLHLTLAPAPLALVAAPLALFAVLWRFYLWRREARLVDVLRMVFWTAVFSNLLLLPMYIVVRASMPLVDGTLARADTALGWGTGAAVAWGIRHPGIESLLSLAYRSLTLFFIVCVMVPAFIGQRRDVEAVLFGVVIGVGVTLVFVFVLPAVGPWETGTFTPDAEQVACGRAVRLLHTAEPMSVNLLIPDPIVCLPSWHVILAVLSALSARRVPGFGPVAALWSSLIIVSTLTTGWHYLVDVILGLIVAFAAHAVAQKWVMPRLAEAKPIAREVE